MRPHRTIIKTLLDVVFPSQCLGCAKQLTHGGVLCESCLLAIPTHRTFFCGKCASRLPENKKVCHRDFPYLLGAAGDYHHEILKSLVASLKFKSIRAASAPLAELMCAYMERVRIATTGAIVIPIPLGLRRTRQRGFNQSELLGEYIARRFLLPFHPECLTRTRETLPQSELADRKERADNVRGCFDARHQEHFSEKTVFLIDDVATSGTTLFEAATTLRRAGAKKIIAIVAARA